MNLILIAVVSLGIIALVAAGILYAASKRFAVYEDPRIAKVAEVLPQANCGGCGYPGCNGLAGAIVKAGSLEGKFCPVGGQPVMEKVAAVMGLAAEASEPMVAVVRCNGTCEHRPRLTEYDGVRTCAIAAATYGGETGCSFGCLGCGDCVAACKFDAIHMNPETGLPEVDDEKCTGCGACTKACPRSIIELRYKGKNNRRVYVRCVNKDKGPVAKKACAVACIACGKCEKACPFGAITVENNVAYIDFHKCKSCRKCVSECPQHSIIDLNFPPLKVVKAEAPKAEAPKVVEVPKAAAMAQPLQGGAMPSAAAIEALLPQANCGGCGFDDCPAFAAAVVNDGGIGEKFCSVGGAEVMDKIAALLASAAAAPVVETAPVVDTPKVEEPVVPKKEEPKTPEDLWREKMGYTAKAIGLVAIPQSRWSNGLFQSLPPKSGLEKKVEAAPKLADTPKVVEVPKSPFDNYTAKGIGLVTIPQSRWSNGLFLPLPPKARV
ncbi:MAG: Fe-S cluster domain-containing protein [Bacteroidaceae bacterium]|nr:Fe-S cluster domain-containing protein [Bacteroidaceae bacterium]